MTALDMLIKLISPTTKILIFILLINTLIRTESPANENLVIEIDKPRFSEKGLDNRLYEIKAERGIQKEDNLELYIVEGKLRTDSGIWIYLNAEKGDFNQLQNSIKLSGRITFYTEENDKFQSDYAYFLINEDLMKFSKNVKHVRDGSVIEADESTIQNNFDYLVYEGNVRTSYLID